MFLPAKCLQQHKAKKFQYQKNLHSVVLFIKKGTVAQAFFYEFCEVLKNTFFVEHLRWLLQFVTIQVFVVTFYIILVKVCIILFLQSFVHMEYCSVYDDFSPKYKM